jgi:hypothetical protein
LPPTTTSSSTTTSTVLPATTSPTTTVAPTPTTVPENLALLPDDVVIQTEPEEGVLDIEDLKNVEPDEVLLISKIEDQELAEDVAHVLDGEVSVEEITEIVQSENFETLDDGVKQAIAKELSDESKEIKETFEEEVNIFEGGFDDYVPQDSLVDVGTRRVITAVTTIAVVIPTSGGGSAGGVSKSKSSSRGGRK